MNRSEKQGWSGKSVCVCVCVCVRAHACVHTRHSVMLDSATPWTWTARFLCPRNSSGKNAGMCSLSILQGIFPTQISNPGLQHCRWILYHLSHWDPLGEERGGWMKQRGLEFILKYLKFPFHVQDTFFSTLTPFCSYQDHNYSLLSDPFQRPVLVRIGLHNPQCPARPFYWHSCFQCPWTPRFPRLFQRTCKVTVIFLIIL